MQWEKCNISVEYVDNTLLVLGDLILVLKVGKQSVTFHARNFEIQLDAVTFL